MMAGAKQHFTAALFTARTLQLWRRTTSQHVAPMVRCCCQRSFLPLAAISIAFVVTANSWLSRNITAGHYGFSQFAQDSFVLEPVSYTHLTLPTKA